MVVSRKRFTKQRAGLVTIPHNDINANAKPKLLMRSHVVEWFAGCGLEKGYLVKIKQRQTACMIVYSWV